MLTEILRIQKIELVPFDIEMEREHNIINSLYLQADELERKNFERFERYKIIEENEVMYEEYMTDDADIIIAATGIASRISLSSVEKAREKGIKAGLIRPITLWPFPKAAFAKAADHCQQIIAVELNMGQMIEDIRMAVEYRVPVSLYNRTGGVLPDVYEILGVIENAAKGGMR